MENLVQRFIYTQLCSCVSLLLFHTYKGVWRGKKGKLQSTFLGEPASYALIGNYNLPMVYAFLLSGISLSFSKGSPLLFSSPAMPSAATHSLGTGGGYLTTYFSHWRSSKRSFC